MKYIKGDFTIVPNIRALDGQSASVRSVFLSICSHANGDGICFPSRATISTEAGITIRTVDECIAKLVSLGLLAKESRKIGKENDSNIYQILLFDKGGSAMVAPPSAMVAPGGSAKSTIVTIPIINYKEANASRRPFCRYSEQNHSDSEEPTLDAESGDLLDPSDKPPKDSVVSDLVKWAEKRRGKPFLSRPKQLKAINQLKKAGIHPLDIIERWKDLENEQFYQEHGLDFMSLVASFDRKPK